MTLVCKVADVPVNAPATDRVPFTISLPETVRFVPTVMVPVVVVRKLPVVLLVLHSAYTVVLTLV